MRIKLENVINILNAEDIEGLLELGAPQDEYSSEATQIFEAIKKLERKDVTKTNITAVISLVWKKFFDCSAEDIEQRLPAFQRVAEALLISRE